MANEMDPPDGAFSTLTRRLATILSSDVAGYSRMMGENEEATVQTLRAHRAVFDALLKQHHGRVFNTAGDAILAEFPSAVEAVRCATEIQSALQTRNEHLPLGQKMLFRMGVNIGDVVVQNGDLLGDGVNIAARIQSVAEPGGICISGSVYDQIQNKLSLQFISLGDLSFKNIAQPIRTFSITHGETQALPVARLRTHGKLLRGIVAGAIACAVLAAGGYWYYRDNETRRQDQNALTAQLAVEKRATEEARRAADEQGRRATEAESKVERERLAAESAKRETALQAKAQQVNRDNETRRQEQNALTAQLAVEKRATEEARRAADEQGRRATEAESKVERERLAAESAKRETALQAKAQSVEEAQRRTDAERKQLDEEKRRLEAEKQANRATLNGQTTAGDNTGQTKAARMRPAGGATAAKGPADGNGEFDGSYTGQLCNSPADPSKKTCWSVPLKVQSGTASGTWINRLIGKPAFLHATIGPGGTVAGTLDGWIAKDGAPRTGALNGYVANGHIDINGRWANGVRVDGHWTRTQ